MSRRPKHEARQAITTPAGLLLKLVASRDWRATGNGGADGLAQDDIVGSEGLAVAEIPRLRRDVVLFKAEPAVEIQAPPVGEEAGQHDFGDGRQVGGDGGVEGHEQRAQAGSESRLIAGTRHWYKTKLGGSDRD